MAGSASIGLLRKQASNAASMKTSSARRERQDRSDRCAARNVISPQEPETFGGGGLQTLAQEGYSISVIMKSFQWLGRMPTGFVHASAS
jgi:hypothetical protein